MKVEARSMAQVQKPWPGHPAMRHTQVAFIVGVTGDGSIPLVEEPAGWSGGSLIALPCLEFDGPPLHRFDDGRLDVVRRIRQEFGYEAGELVPMKARSLVRQATPPFLLAPLLGVARWRATLGCVPGVREVPLWNVAEWLRQRGLAGARESPSLREGLLLAEGFFPQWAQMRIGQALTELTRRAPSAVATA